MKNRKSTNDNNGSGMVMVARYLGLAFLIPISAGAGWMIGQYMDKQLHTGYLALTCLVLGIIGSFIQLIRELLRDADKQ